MTATTTIAATDTIATTTIATDTRVVPFIEPMIFGRRYYIVEVSFKIGTIGIGDQTDLVETGSTVETPGSKF